MDKPALAISATFTAEPAEPVQQFWLNKIGWSEQVQFAPFNQVFQSLLEPPSAINTATGAAVLLIRLQDWVETAHQTISSAEWQKRLAPVVEEFLEAVKNPRRSLLLVVLCPPSPAILQDPATAALFESIEKNILASLKDAPSVHAFGSGAATHLYPTTEIHDERGDELGRIPYQPAYFAALSSFVMRQAHAARMKPCKVIVLDCDNTLWRGVCGEGGVAAVTVDRHFRALQEMAVRQIEKGRVICLCSKNVEQDVFDIFDRHPDMLLRKDQLVAWRINWQPKSQNLRELAGELNLGLDSFLLLDDNPIECAEVRENCPEVMTIQIPVDPSDIPRFLDHLWPLDQLRVTDQDRQRTQSYQQNTQREEIRRQSAGLEDFLARLQLGIHMSQVDPQTVPRASQLTERTNQFNVSTIRRGEAQIQQLIDDPRHTVEVVAVKDRFGDYGMVGQIISRREETSLVLDTFLLSCRVLGRGVEHRMIAHAGELALALGLPWVEIPFIRTLKNQPALDFLDAVAMDFRTETNGGLLYKIPAAKAAALKATEMRPSDELPQESSEPPARAVELPATPYEEIASQWRDVPAILAAVKERQRCAAALGSKASGFVAPRNDREQQMAEIWRRAMNLDRIGIHDDYFASGGTSLQAVRLVMDVEKHFGKSIPIAALLKAPTIAQFCELMGNNGTLSPAPPSDEVAARHAQAEALAIAPLREEGSNVPLVVFAGIGGHTFGYGKLVKLLDTDQPVYGMDFRADVAANHVPRPLETMAAEFVDRLLKFLPDGPYHLAGWSFGGYLAFAVAHRLKHLGKDVGALVLLDTYGPGFPRALSRQERLAEHLKRLRKRSASENARYLLNTSKGVFSTLWHRILRATGVRKSEFYLYPNEIERVAQLCDQAARAYVPSRWPGVLTLIRAKRYPERIGVSYADSTNGWHPFAKSIETREIDADHLSLFDEPHLPDLAAALSDTLKGRLSE